MSARPAPRQTSFVPFLLCLCMTLPLLGIAHEASASPGQSDTEPFTMMARPMTILRMVSDPWLDGLWLGTEAGLFLKSADADVPMQVTLGSGLSDPRVYDISPTPDSVWIAQPTGPAVLSKETHELRQVHLADGSVLSAFSRMVWVEGDHAWVGTDKKGLYKVDLATLVAQEVKNPVDGTSFDKPVMSVGSDGPLLFISVTNYGLVQWDRDTGKAERYNTSYVLHQPQYLRLAVTPGWVWVATGGDGVVAYNRTHDQVLEYAAADNVNTRVTYDARPLGPEIWFPTNAGASRYNERTGEWRYWQGMPWRGLLTIAVLDGQVYGGTSDHHVIQYDRVRDTWGLVGWWESRSPPHNAVQSCDRDGDRLLFGTGGGGASYYDPATGTWSAVGKEPGDHGGLQDIYVTSTASDAKGRFFTTYLGVDENHRGDSSGWTHTRTDGATNDAQTDAVVKVRITPTDAWTATLTTLHRKARSTSPDVYSRGNLGHLDRATGAWTFYGKADGLSSDNVSAVLPLPDAVWIGTPVGLDKMDPATRQVTHVWPRNGDRDAVTDLIQSSTGDIWFTSLRDGLVSIDPATGRASRVQAFFDSLATTLTEVDGKIWVGTMRSGLAQFDPATKTTAAYHTGVALDRAVHCLIADRGVLYIGDDWGVDRLDLARNAWIPQVTLPGLPLEEQEKPLRVTLDPLVVSQVEPGTELDVKGTSQGPSDAVVQVRVGDLPWTSASGTNPWHATVDVDQAAYGPTRVEARLVRPGANLTVAVRWLQVGDPESGPLPRHVPIQAVTAGETARFEVEAATAANGAVMLRMPGQSSWSRLPLQQEANGTYVATSPRFLAVGQANYYITMETPGGRARLPAPGSGYGTTYSLAVRPTAGLARAFVLADGDRVAAVPGGQPATLRVTVQNTGLRTAEMTLSASGTAAAWTSGIPDPFLVAAGESHQVDLSVRIPADTDLATYPLDLEVAVPSGQGTGFLAHFNVTAVTEQELAALQLGQGGATQSSHRGVPAPGLAMLAAGLAVVAAFLRQRPPRRRATRRGGLALGALLALVACLPAAMAAATSAPQPFQVVSTTPALHGAVALHGDAVAWASADPTSIHVWITNLTQGTTREVTSVARTPGVTIESLGFDGHWVVWSDNRAGKYAISAVDARSGSLERLTQGTTDETGVGLDAGRAVWLRGTQLQAFDLDHGQAIALPSVVGPSFDPTIQGDLIAWSQMEGSTRGIRVHDLAGHVPDRSAFPSSSLAFDVQPKIMGGTVYWEQRTAAYTHGTKQPPVYVGTVLQRMELGTGLVANITPLSKVAGLAADSGRLAWTDFGLPNTPRLELRDLAANRAWSLQAPPGPAHVSRSHLVVEGSANADAPLAWVSWDRAVAPTDWSLVGWGAAALVGCAAPPLVMFLRRRRSDPENASGGTPAPSPHEADAS